MQDEFENTKGIFRRRIPKKDRQEEFEDTKEYSWAAHRRRTHTKTLKIQKE
jgi:hypothetical protein